MSYQVEIRIPKRFLDDGLAQAVTDYFQEPHDTKKIVLEYTEADNFNMLHIDDDESRYGKMEQIQTYCEANNIPYDMYCGNNYEYDPERSYFRPGMQQPKDTPLTMEDNEYILATTVMELLDEFNSLSKAAIQQKLIEQLDKSSSWQIEPLENFATETPLGKNKDAMSRIDGVLAKVDSGEIDIKEAMDEIKVIQEEAKNIYLVAVLAPYVDGCAIISNPLGEFGGEGYIEFKDTKQLVLGRWHANDQEEAISLAADQNDVSTEILTAYQLS